MIFFCYHPTKLIGFAGHATRSLFCLAQRWFSQDDVVALSPACTSQGASEVLYDSGTGVKSANDEDVLAM